MKYAFMSFSTPDLDLPKTLYLARHLGYDGLEPRLDAGHLHGIEVDTSTADRQRILEQVQASHIGLPCLATSLKFADPETSQSMRQQARSRIILAGDLKIPCMRVFGGAIPSGIEREQAIEVVADNLRKLADLAAEHEVTLCLETHDDWCDPGQVAAVMARVDHPAVAVNWDIMHPVRTGCATMRQAFDLLKPWIRHLHVHDGVVGDDGKLTLTPIGEGIVNHAAALRYLSEIDYDGFISGEWINWEPYDLHLPRELKTLRHLETVSAGPAADY